MKLPIFLFLVLHAISGKSQSWIQELTSDGKGFGIRSAVEMENGNILAPGARYEPNTNTVVSNFYLLDKEGELLAVTPIVIEGVSDCIVSLQRVKDGRILFIAFVGPLDGPQYAVVGWVNNDLSLTAVTKLDTLANNFLGVNLAEFDDKYVGLAKAWDLPNQTSYLTGVSFNKELGLTKIGDSIHFPCVLNSLAIPTVYRGNDNSDYVYHANECALEDYPPVYRVTMNGDLKIDTVGEHPTFNSPGAKENTSGYVKLNGDYYLFGQLDVNDPINASSDLRQYIIRFDSAGNRLDSLLYNNLREASATNTAPLSYDKYGNFLLVGEGISRNGSDSRNVLMLANVSQQLQTNYTRMLELEKELHISTVLATSDGGFLVQGAFFVNDVISSAALIKFDSLGTLSWVNTVTPNAEKITVFPSLANEYFNVMLPGDLIQADVQVLNSIGQEVFSGKFTGGQDLKVDCVTWPQGNYFVLCYAANGVRTAKLVKQ